MVRYILICFLFVSCNNAQSNNALQNVKADSNKIISKDTLITYDIEGISTEGAGAKVHYVNGNISTSTTYLFSGTGQKSITYYFEKSRIKVLEKHYYYKTEMENVKSDEDMQLDKELTYYIDFTGNVIGNSIEDRIDIFKEFKEVVPFELRN